MLMIAPIATSSQNHFVQIYVILLVLAKVAQSPDRRRETIWQVCQSPGPSKPNSLAGGVSLTFCCYSGSFESSKERCTLGIVHAKFL